GTLVLHHGDQQARHADAGELPGGGAGGAHHEVRRARVLEEGGGGAEQLDGLPGLGAHRVPAVLGRDDAHVGDPVGGGAGGGQGPGRAGRVGAAHDDQHPCAAAHVVVLVGPPRPGGAHLGAHRSVGDALQHGPAAVLRAAAPLGADRGIDDDVGGSTPEAPVL